MDWAARKLLTWQLSNTLDARFCVEALEEAISQYGKLEIMNTDQGSQYTPELDHNFDGSQNQNINGWQGPLTGPHLYQTPVAVVETGDRLSA